MGGWSRWTGTRIALSTGSRLHAADIKGLANRHIGSRNNPALSHQHRRIVAHRIQLTQTKGLERNQRLHAIIAWEYQHLHRIQRNPVSYQELLKMLMDKL